MTVPAPRILQVVASTDRRGAEVFATDLGEALTARGREVGSVALHAGAVGGLDLPVLGRQSLGPSTLAALRKATRWAGVVVAHGSTSLPACALATAFGGPPFAYRNIGDPLYWAGRGLRRVRVAGFLRRARAVAVLWDGAARTLRDRFGVPPDRIRVIPNGVPAHRFPVVTPDARRAARLAVQIDGSTPVLAYLGALTPEKDLSTAISAVGALDDVHLLVAGDGPERPRLEARAGSAAPGRVHFLGSVGDPERVLAAADAVVLASRSEGIPAVLIEAAFSGLPAVATDVGGIREVVVNGETGLLAPPGDPRALADAVRGVLKETSAMGARAHARCRERFEIGMVATAWEQLLDDVARAANAP